MQKYWMTGKLITWHITVYEFCLQHVIKSIFRSRNLFQVTPSANSAINLPSKLSILWYMKCTRIQYSAQDHYLPGYIHVQNFQWFSNCKQKLSCHNWHEAADSSKTACYIPRSYNLNVTNNSTNTFPHGHGSSHSPLLSCTMKDRSIHIQWYSKYSSQQLTFIPPSCGKGDGKVKRHAGKGRTQCTQFLQFSPSHEN